MQFQIMFLFTADVLPWPFFPTYVDIFTMDFFPSGGFYHGHFSVAVFTVDVIFEIHSVTSWEGKLHRWN